MSTAGLGARPSRSEEMQVKAAAFSAFGPPDVLRLVDLVDPIPGPGEVRVRVRAAGVQPIDCAIRGGFSPPGGSISFPQVVGNEFAGTIDRLGEDVNRFAIGDEVLGFRLMESYAELVVVSADQLVSKPAAMPWAVAGGLTGAGQTASVALDVLQVSAGETVLIHAAAGAVGTVTVQLARLRGATVIGTASEVNHAYLRDLGAIPVTYGDGLIERVRALAPSGVDAAFDAAGRGALRASVELVADRSRIGTIYDYDLVEELGVVGIRGQRSAARLAELVKLHQQGKLRIHIRKTFRLDEAADAHREVETGHGHGKVVLTVN